MKTQKLLICILISVFCILPLVGCSEVMMSPGYKVRTEMTAINVAELNKRCQAGDDIACQEGLKRASEALNLLVDAMHGIDSTAAIGGDDPNE